MTDQRPRLPISRPDFWAACFLDEYAYDVPGGDVDVSDDEYAPDLVVEYGGGGGYALLVSCTSYGVTLKLCHPGAAKPVELGWDDLAHWHPHALRWSEVDLVCRATALADPDAGYPGPHLALLGRFGPACTEADAAVAVPLLREAFTTLPGLDRYQRHTYASRGDIRAFGVRWKKDPTGWWYPCQGGDTSEESHDPYRDDPDAEDYLDGGLYSTREPGDSDFPFAALAATVDRARARCAALREQPWAVAAPVQAAADTFGGHPSAAHRAGLIEALQAVGCVDRAVLGALAPDAGELRALVMAELLLGVEPGSLVRARSGLEAPRPLRHYYANAYLPVAQDAPRKGLASQLKPRLNTALRAAGLGTTDSGPVRLGRHDGSSVDDLPLRLIDDWRAGLELVREVLRTAGAPEGSTVEVRRRGETVTANLEQPLPRD
ncbi:hypothetical protein E1295_00015 [Nonomuraea mesophila]|uniref:Uncharacterized protein n=1 Tax=Nonomuraea mesophila TaxID=2530382 RepID=A0A4R5FXP2_9ACTN|nr:hypothetical protein [Nonomuraea mesophila]TDE60274.1 hypothetical protein E1295_00015 [Nonomuraea mesophila]